MLKDKVNPDFSYQSTFLTKMCKEAVNASASFEDKFACAYFIPVKVLQKWVRTTTEKRFD